MSLLSVVASVLLVVLMNGVYAAKKEDVPIAHRNVGLINKDGCGTSPKRNLGPLFQVPWVARIAHNTSRGSTYSCVGTIISDRYVLTAAHCVQSIPKHIKIISVRLGDYDFKELVDCTTIEGQVTCADPPLEVGIEEIIPHSAYSKRSFKNDIALLRLNQTVDFSSDSIRPICLPVSSEERNRRFHEGELLTVIGWGSSSRGVVSQVVQQKHVEFVPTPDCDASYRNYSERIMISDSQICLRGTASDDATAGDGGGPLVDGGFQLLDRVTQYGIVSFGPQGQSPPGVYTRVSSYVTWILDNMK